VTTAASGREWPLRRVPGDLARRYVADGHWTDETLGQTVEKGLARLGDTAFAVHSKVRPWRGTMRDVDRAARAFATALRQRGVGRGDIVVFQMPNWVEAAVLFWGAAYVGAVVVPVVHFYGPKELGYIVEVTDPAVVVTPDRFGSQDHLAAYESLLGERAAGSPWLVVGDTPAGDLPTGAGTLDALLDADPIAAPLRVDPDAPAMIAFTSGTTRDPKGVIHSHRTIGFEARQLSGMSPGGGPPQITGAPVGHFIGMLNAFLISLLRDAPVNLLDVWDPAEVLRLMRDEHLSMGGGATYFLTSVLDHPDFRESDAAQMPFIGLGGSSVPAAVAERASRLGIEVYRSYGSTEHPSITGSYLDEPATKRYTTDGHALPGVEIRLDDETGEILSRGPDLFVGYTDPALTASVFDGDGWYRTGDVGVLDADGYLTITDRVADFIIRGGENISAQEVEELVARMDAVAEVSVVAEPDDRLGERAAAVVRVRDGMAVPTLAEVRDHLAGAGLAKQKWPEAIYAVADLPRTPSGKVQKFRLRQQLRDGTLASTDLSPESAP
jgi:acyl-CoA synthetase (AMP-forming)/AMP-acid ligase II